MQLLVTPPRPALRLTLAPTVVAIPDDQRIIGGPDLPWARMVELSRRVRTQMPLWEAEAIASAYTTLGQISGIGSLIPFAQGLHETGWWTSQRWVLSFNPAGLGATNDGQWGGHFETVAAGIWAQYAHLLAYAAIDAQLRLPQRLLVAFDPRLSALVRLGWRGIAPRWIDLSTRWAWPGTTYGQRVLQVAREIAQ